VSVPRGVYGCAEEEVAFAVFRETKAIGKHRGMFLRMMANDKVVLTSCEDKDGIGKFHSISKELKPSAESFAGMVRVHHFGERFTIASNEQKPLDDREAELAGVAFVPGGKGAGLASVSLVLTANGRPHFAIAKRWNMSRVALEAAKGEAIDAKFISFRSIVPVVRDDWKTCLGLDSAAVVKSCKNCVITNANGERLFALWKLGNDWFSVRCKAPVSPFVAFGLAVAIIGSAK
jgi:hypothetical protein